MMLLMLATMTTMKSATVDELKAEDQLQTDQHKDTPFPAQHRHSRTLFQHSILNILGSSFQQLIHTSHHAVTTSFST